MAKSKNLEPVPPRPDKRKKVQSTSTEHQVDAPIGLSWNYGPGQPPNSTWKKAVRTEILQRIPQATLDAWRSHSIPVDESGHADEQLIVRESLNQALNELNRVNRQRRAGHVFALDGANPNPLTVEYIWVNGLRICRHTYELVLDGSPWEIAHPTASDVHARLQIQLWWETRLAGSTPGVAALKNAAVR